MPETTAPSTEGFPAEAALDAAMRAALAAAELGPRGANPLVGAVLLTADGTLLATDHHQGAGTAHAEAALLARLPELAGEAEIASLTLVVTLEPCDHTGRRGPCTQAIIDAGIRRVVYAADDPHAVAAGGARTLRNAGVQVRSGVLAEESRALNSRWQAAVRAPRPFVTLKLAQSADGCIAAADGTSQWITGPEARAHAHELRARADAVLVGTGTVLADDPSLTARDQAGTLLPRQPLRAVMGLRTVPAGAAVLRGPAHGGASSAGVRGGTARGADGHPGAVLLRSRDPREALDVLYSRGVRHVMVEGGAQVAAAFLRADLVDEFSLYQAPLLLGRGLPALADLGIGTLTDRLRFCPDPAGGGPVRQLGDDLWWHLQPR